MADDALPPLPKPQYGLLKPQLLNHQQESDAKAAEAKNRKERDLSPSTTTHTKIDADTPHKAVQKEIHKQQTTAPIFQGPEKYQPAQGQSRLGRNIQTGQYVDVPQVSRRQGLYIIGATGTGKTGLIENLIIQDIKQGLGIALLDPHGDLTDAVLSRLPDTRFVDGVERVTEQDVILLDIKNTQYPFGLNLLSCPDPSDLVALTIASAHVMHIFRKLWGKGGILVEDAWGVLLEKILLNATKTLLENPGYTMAEIPLLLDIDNPSFRKELIQNLMSDAVRDFWEREFATLSTRDQREEIQSTLTRVNSFLTEQLIRNIIGQSRTTIDFRAIMDERKILLVRLNVRLGEGITTLLGTMILAGILDAAYSRANLPVSRRKQFNLYADEFQRFASEDFATLLTEARKYGVATTIAHQMRSQLDTQNRGATLNVANLVVFKVSGADAAELAGEFDIDPQEAWEEELEEERFEQKIDVIEEEVEEDIEEIAQNPIEYLTSARGTHRDSKVTQAIRILLEYYSNKSNHLSGAFDKLLVEMMEGREMPGTDTLVEKVHLKARSIIFTSWSDFRRDVPNEYALCDEKLRRFVEAIIKTGQADDSIINDLYETTLEAYFAKFIYERNKERNERNYPPERNMLSEKEIAYLRKGLLRENDDKVVVCRLFIKQLQTILPAIKSLCEGLAADPIRVPTGQKRLVPKKRTHLSYLTHPRVAITHPQRTYADMVNEVASQLANLPTFTARAKIATEGKPVEFTIKTLEPERGLGRIALQERIERIQAHNRDYGHTRFRQEVEAEIRTRQEQWRKPPNELPPVTRRTK